MRSYLLFLAVPLSIGGIAPGCYDPPPSGLPGPGSTLPEQACAQASDCGCWQCDCVGVEGAPGGAQLCVDGKCPTGEAACTPICAIVGAKLATATAIETCPGRP